MNPPTSRRSIQIPTLRIPAAHVRAIVAAWRLPRLLVVNSTLRRSKWSDT